MKIMNLAEFRCKWCGKLLSKICIDKGRIEIKCSNKECKRNRERGINSYEVGYKDLEFERLEEKTAEIKEGTVDIKEGKEVKI